MQCAFLHILNFPTYIVHRFMYCFFLYILCIASCLTLNSMYCVLCHALCLTPCLLHAVSCLVLDSMPPVCCVMPCAWSHVRVCCVVSCLVLDSMPPVCCVMACACPMPVCHSIYPTLLHACQVSFWTYICFFKLYIQNFFGLRIDIHIFLFFWI